MAKNDLKQKALKLRAKGRSYNQIRQEVKVSKSTLSLWLRSHPLSKTQMRSLRDFSEVRIEKFRETMLLKRKKRFESLYQEEKRKLLPLTHRELFIAGTFLYWGEGLKDLKYPFAIYNTNPQMIKFALIWYTKILKIPAKQIRIKLHLYSDMVVQDEVNFWSRELKLPPHKFGRPYIKSTKKNNIKYKGTFGHGTCGIVVNNVRIKERIMAGLQAMSDFYANQI